MSLWNWLFRSKRREEDLGEEIQIHLRMAEQEYREWGESAEQARAAALREFGNVVLVKETTRDQWGFRWLETLLQDLRYGLRGLRKSPGFTVVAVLTLALGIGANTAIFSVVDAVLLEPLPYPHPEQIVQVWEKTSFGQRGAIATLDFLDWKKQNTVFEGMAALTGASMALTGRGIPVELAAARVSALYFSIFRARPLLGRTFAPDEDQSGKEHVVVLSHRIWENRFGANPSVIGRSIQLNGEAYTVIGVMPAKTFDHMWEDVWVPLAFEPKQMTRDFHWLLAWARMKPGVTFEQAQRQMNVIGTRIAHDYPQTNKGWSVTVDRYAEQLVNASLRKSLIVLFAAVGAVLLMCCVNLANLLLVRGAEREREVAIRSALGGGRGRLVRLFLTESILLAGLGGMAGVFFGWGMIPCLKSWLPPYLVPPEADVRLNGGVLLFTAGLVLVTGVLFGVVPALHGSRIDLVESLKEGSRGATHGVTRKRVRSVLVAAEIALAFILLSGAGLLLRSFDQLQEVNLGFDPTNVITMRLPMSSKDYPDGPSLINYQQQVMDRVRAIPGVRNAALASVPPLRGSGFGMPFQIEGRPIIDPSNRPACGFKIVTPTYLSTVGMHLLKGRWLDEADTPGALPVAVINESMAKQFFKEQDPIGQRIRIQQIVPDQPALGPEIPWQVVGVVTDEKTVSLADSGWWAFYVSYKQSPTEFAGTLIVRGEKDPTYLVKSIQSAVWQINKNQPFDYIKTLDQIKSESLNDNRTRTVLLGVFGIVALMIAAIGIYGVISNAVAQRTHEMGVRAALGATRWDQLRLVLTGGMVLTGVGMGIGIIGAVGLTRFLASLLFGVSPYDPWTLTATVAILTSVAFIACLIPARSATKVDPMVALRYE